MARHESDREDLMAEAVALRHRIELQVPELENEVIFGFRDDGRFSIYFGSDPAYQFDELGRLRRAFIDGDLYRTQETTLARLTRERTEATSSLIRHDLNAVEITAFLTRMFETLRMLKHAIKTEEIEIVQQIPEDEEILSKLFDALNLILTVEHPFAPPININR